MRNAECTYRERREAIECCENHVSPDSIVTGIERLHSFRRIGFFYRMFNQIGKTVTDVSTLQLERAIRIPTYSFLGHSRQHSTYSGDTHR